jgi:gluconolactonase
MRKPSEILAREIGSPEGPDLLPDGRIVAVEMYRSRVVAWSAERGTHLYAGCGGGPNACMLGSDGALYITQNGGTAGAWRAEAMVAPSIQKAWPDGRVEEIVTEVDGYTLQAPNDLTFGPDGRLYFTDPADYTPGERRRGRVFALNPDGTGSLLADLPAAYPNGITCEADGNLVFTESYERRVYRLAQGRDPVMIHQLPEGHIPDGLKIDEHDNLWISTMWSHGVDIVAPDGSALDFLETGGCPLNCVFDGDSLIITNFGDVADGPAVVPMDGWLERVAVGVRGMSLFRGAIG